MVSVSRAKEHVEHAIQAMLHNVCLVTMDIIFKKLHVLNVILLIAKIAN